jgi:4-hydroxybenzoate polyprenyltransferase
MGTFKTVLLATGFGIIFLLLAVSLMIPYAFGAVVIAIVSLLFVCAYFLREHTSLYDRSEMKTFYCPFRRMIVNVKFLPSIFTFRTYDDVLKCSAFKDKIRCKKLCLDLQDSELNTQL